MNPRLLLSRPCRSCIERDMHLILFHPSMGQVGLATSCEKGFHEASLPLPDPAFCPYSELELMHTVYIHFHICRPYFGIASIYSHSACSCAIGRERIFICQVCKTTTYKTKMKFGEMRYTVKHGRGGSI